jgi:hypothetical protein
MKTTFKKINYDPKTGEPVSVDIYEEYTREEFLQKFPNIVLYIPSENKYPYPVIINNKV